MKTSAFAITGIAAGLIGLTVLLPAAKGATNAPHLYHPLDVFDEALDRVHSRYVREAEDSELVSAAINGMVSALDPHSSYMSPKEYANMQVENRGIFGGLGLDVTLEDGLLKVVAPIDDTPAARAGIKPGDFISAIDGTITEGMPLNEAVERMRGPADSTVTLTLRGHGEKKAVDIVLRRAVIHVESVKYQRKGDIGYIRISSFTQNTDAGLTGAVTDLKKQIGPALKGYVLDLRNNPGGLLDQAIAVSDDFLTGGEVVSTRGRMPEDTQRYYARSGDIADGKPIIVLINEGTASASEIVAGALQDNHRATILGVTSFGKGSVQTIIPLQGSRGGALRLTTAKYYTPSGRSIQATGIAPDIAVSNLNDKDQVDADQATSRSEASLAGHLDAEGERRTTEKRIIRPEADKSYDDFQLSYAVEQLNSNVAALLPPGKQARGLSGTR